MVDNLPMQPTPDAYEKAFAAIEDQITEKQLLMLAFHHAQPGRAVSATKLAEFIGYKNYNAVNMQYGRLGSMICQQLGLELPGVQVGSLVDFVYPDQAANDHFLWLMRPQVALALERLGWVPAVSQYLYPHAALQQMFDDDAAESSASE